MRQVREDRPQAIASAFVSAGMSRFTYHEPLDPDCPDVRRFGKSLETNARIVRCGWDVIEEFERRHRAECERCHVYGAVHMEIHDA